jgi:hypothetical protein
MKFLTTLGYILLFSISVQAAPVIQYKADLQSYSFPELTISAEVFFTEVSQYSGIEIYYYPELIIPDVFRGISLEENELLRLLDKNFSVIKSFKSNQLAALQILPAGQYNSNNLRRAGAVLVEKSQSSEALKEMPALLSDQRVRVLKATAKKEQVIANITAKRESQKQLKEQRKIERQLKKKQKLAAQKQEDLIELKHFYDADKDIYNRLLPFYKNQFGEPDFSEISTQQLEVEN